MKKLKVAATFFFAVIIASVLTAPGALALADPDVGATAVVLVEAQTGQVLYSKNENARMDPASLTKIMTVLLAVEAIEAGRFSAYDEVQASENSRFDVSADSSTANIVPGEIMSLESLMYCALVKSANEACNIIAEYIGGTVADFVTMMNDRARELGCTGTRFSNTHGLTDAGHYTTAWDLYLIASKAMSYSLFMEIANTHEITIDATNLSGPRELVNTNALLGDTADATGYTYSKATGIKTGYTSAAGYCLVSSAADERLELVSVVMNAQATTMTDGSTHWGHFADTVTLFDWVFNNFSFQDIIKTTDTVTQVPISLGSDSEYVNVRPETSIRALLPSDVNAESFERDIVIFSERDGETLEAPLHVGTVLGEVTLTMNGEVYGTVNLVAASTVELSKRYYLESEIQKALESKWVKITAITFAVLFLAYLVLAVRYRVIRMRHVMSVRRAKRSRSRMARMPQDIGGDGDSGDEYFYEDEEEDEYSQYESPARSENRPGERDYYEDFFK